MRVYRISTSTFRESVAGLRRPGRGPVLVGALRVLRLGSEGRRLSMRWLPRERDARLLYVAGFVRETLSASSA